MPKFVHPSPFILHPDDDLTTRLPHLRQMSARLADAYASGHAVSEAELQTVGAALWGALPEGTAEQFKAAIQAAGANILPVIIESGAPAVQALPWETLHHPQRGFLARQPGFTLSRRTTPSAADSLPARPAPLKVLLFTSLPDDLDPEKERLDVEKEQERVQEALLPWIAEGRAQLEIPDDGRLETLGDLLKRFEPHILYLSGHGKFIQQAGVGIFLFESETGASRPVTEDQLAEALMGSGVQAVVLSACESGKAASDDLNHGLARRLAALGIPHVIGMRESVLDQAGIQFADALCAALAGGERADVAIQTARAAMTQPAAGVSRREAGLDIPTSRQSGQWCLPMLLAPNPAQPTADWAGFSPSPLGRGAGSGRQKPMRFIGRRKELRRTKHRLLTGALTRLFISGAGGHGKTTLARKLVRELETRGYASFEWRADSPWRDFQTKLEDALDGDAGKTYDRLSIRLKDQPETLAAKLFEFLAEQYEGRLVLLFDNLEALQDPQTRALTDPVAGVWLKAACQADLILLATSRWLLPDWDGEHLPLESMNKGDFLRLAQALTERGQMNPLLLTPRERLTQVYETLARNPRGLEWFAAATLTMNPQEEETFVRELAQTRADLRQNMALEETTRRLPPQAWGLLCRLHVYAEPVPAEGILKLGLGLPDPEAALEALLAFSLLEVTENKAYDALEYQAEPALLDWLREKELLEDDPRARVAAADYLLWLMEQERDTYPHLALTIEALRRAERHPEADRLTLDRLVGKYTLDGRYAELLTRWLPRVCDSQDLKTRAEALGQTGKLLHHLGDFKNALPFMEQSLAIQQQIGDRAGEGTTLNNISQIYDAQGDYETALTYLKQSLAIRQQIGDRAGEGTTLNNISQIFKAQGDYETALTYLKQSLAIRQQIGDRAGEGTTLNNMATTAHAQGDYETALTYLKQSLAIQQQIGDRAGLCATLFNMGHIHRQNNQMQEAVSAWVTVYVIAKQINEYQALQALSQLAPSLGLPEGLDGWEDLARRVQNGEKIEFEEEEEEGGELEQIRSFVRGLAAAVREKSPDAQKYFESVSKMAVDPKAPPHYQELGKVLQKWMSGVSDPDLSSLPEEWAQVVREAL